VGLGIASLLEGHLSKCVTVTLSTRDLARSGALSVSTSAKVNGKQENLERLVPLAQLNARGILTAIPAMDMFTPELSKAGYFSLFFRRIDALTRQLMAARLLRQGIALDDDGLKRFLAYAAYTMDPYSPGPAKSDINAIKDNARTVNRWFQALAWLTAGLFATANPFLGTIAGGAAAYTTTAYGDCINDNIARLEAGINVDQNRGTDSTKVSDTWGIDLSGKSTGPEGSTSSTDVSDTWGIDLSAGSGGVGGTGKHSDNPEYEY
jgi:hypothetical protein